MDWLSLGGLAIQYGLPFVEKLISNWENKTPVTLQEWQVLVALSQNNPVTMMQSALARAGITSSDLRYKQFMDLVAPVVAPA